MYLQTSKYTSYRFHLLLLSFFVGISIVSCSSKEQSRLKLLDQKLGNYNSIIQNKEENLWKLKERLNMASSLDEKYDIANNLYNEYLYYSLDSAFYYLKLAKDVSSTLTDTDKRRNSELNQGFLYVFSGMYMEAQEIVDSIQVNLLSENLRKNYYYLNFNLFDNLERHTLDSELRTLYSLRKKQYRDSALYYAPTDVVLTAQKYYDEGLTEQSINLLKNNLKDDMTTNEAGLRYYILAEIYEKLNMTEEEKKYLIMASIADCNNAVRQYISLRKLAKLLYNEGDIKRANWYIHHSMSDAVACNSTLRIKEASSILPIIDSALFEKEKREKLLFLIFMFVVIIALIGIFILLFSLKRKNKALMITKNKYESTHHELEKLLDEKEDVNRKLQMLCKDLQESKEEQQKLNESLSVSNKIKLEYVSRFMSACAQYMMKMETYRKDLAKVAKRRNFDELNVAIQSKLSLSKEIDDFYKVFDQAFLRLFPNFVEQLNSLLQDSERLQLKHPHILTTEIRIFALLRLGITDGSLVQTFLRCSASTIYNYRSNMRNRAKKRETFEDDVMKLGDISIE